MSKNVPIDLVKEQKIDFSRKSQLHSSIPPVEASYSKAWSTDSNNVQSSR